MNFATGSLVNVCCIQAFSLVYDKVSVALNSWENHRTETQYQDSLITKSFIFEMVNNYFALFFIAFLKEGTLWGKPSTCQKVEISCSDSAPDCINGEREVSSCMSELQLQLIVVFCVKQFAFQIIEIVVPLVVRLLRFPGARLFGISCN